MQHHMTTQKNNINNLLTFMGYVSDDQMDAAIDKLCASHRAAARMTAPGLREHKKAFIAASAALRCASEAIGAHLDGWDDAASGLFAD